MTIESYIQSPASSHADDDEFDGSLTGTVVTPGGTQSSVVSRHALSVEYANNGSDIMCARLWSLTPTSAPVTIEACIHGFGPAVDFGTMGIGFADGTATTNNLIATSWIYDDPDPQRFTRTGTFASQTGHANLASNIVGPNYRTFVRLIWKAANTWTTQYSHDGITWFTIDADRAYTMTPTHFGVFYSTFTSTETMLATYEYIRVVESDLSA